MNKDDVLKEEGEIVSQIRQYVPLFSRFFDLNMNVREYSKSLYDYEVSETFVARQLVVKNKIQEKLSKLYGSEYKSRLNFEFDSKLAFNIADHHMVLSHPFLISANVVSSINKLDFTQKHNPIIVISSGDVPPNNYFSKSGFIFHDKKVPLFSVSEKEFTSYYIPKREFNFIERLENSDKWKEFNDQERKFLLEHQSFINSLDFSKCDNYCDQITEIVRSTWPLLFEEKTRKHLPDLLYITQEELVTECLVELLKDENNIISKILFDENARNITLNNFRGIVVTWDEAKQKGTHFFWRKYPEQPRSIRMYAKDGKLVPQDKRFEHLAVPLNRETVIELLEKREIYPSLFTIFIYLNFYAGVKPLTGFGSAIYLELMKNAWIKTLNELGQLEEVKLAQEINTDGLVAGLVVTFKRLEGKVKALYAHDVFYEGGLTQDYLEKVFEMKFGDILRVGVADMYDYFSQKYIPPEVKIKKKIGFDDLSSIAFEWMK